MGRESVGGAWYIASEEEEQHSKDGTCSRSSSSLSVKEMEGGLSLL